jgi:hypothetical protein
MKNALIILIIAAIGSFSFIDETTNLLIPGVGVEGYVTVNVSTKNEIKVKFGSNGKEVKHYTSEIETGKKQLYSIELEYKKQGISFYFHPDSDTVFALHVYPPYKGKTSKGIILGTSTMQDVENAYGKTDWFFAGDAMFLEYPGVDFRTSFNGKFPVPQKTMDAAMSKKVMRIAIKGIEE